jgi:hypothetical protein
LIAGFAVSIHCRIWVSTEGVYCAPSAFLLCSNMVIRMSLANVARDLYETRLRQLRSALTIGAIVCVTLPFAAVAGARLHLVALNVLFYLLIVIVFVLTARVWSLWKDLRRRTPDDALKAGLV